MVRFVIWHGLSQKEEYSTCNKEVFALTVLGGVIECTCVNIVELSYLEVAATVHAAKILQNPVILKWLCSAENPFSRILYKATCMYVRAFSESI